MADHADYLHLRDAFMRLQKRFTRQSIVEAIHEGKLATWIVPRAHARLRVPAAYWKARGSKALPRKKNESDTYRPSASALNPYLIGDLQKIADEHEHIDFAHLSVLSEWNTNALFASVPGGTEPASRPTTDYLIALERLWQVLEHERDVMVSVNDVASFIGEYRKKSNGGAPVKTAEDGFWIYLIDLMGDGIGVVTVDNLLEAMRKWRADNNKPLKKYSDRFMRGRVEEALRHLKAHNERKAELAAKKKM